MVTQKVAFSSYHMQGTLSLISFNPHLRSRCGYIHVMGEETLAPVTKLPSHS